MNPDATTTGFRSNTATSGADPDAWTCTLDKTANEVIHAKNSWDQAHNTCLKTASSIIEIVREQFKSLKQSGEKSTVRAARREDMKGLFEGSVSDIFATGYYPATNGIKDSSISYAEDVTRTWSTVESLVERSTRASSAGYDRTISWENWLVRLSAIQALMGLSLHFSSTLWPMWWRKTLNKSDQRKKWFRQDPPARDLHLPDQF